MKIEKKHFAVALIDQENTMFIEHKETKDVDFVHKIPEHLGRIMEISDQQHIYMDYETFVALGRTTLANRFCRIFCSTQKQVAEVGMSTFWRVHLQSELENIINTTNYHQPKSIIFFLGYTDFMNRVFPHCSKLLLTVVNCKTEVEDDFEKIKFPIENAKYYFRKRKDIIPEMMAPIAEYKKLQNQTKIETRVEIADNGMRIIKTNEVKSKGKYDAIFDSPDYMFYEFNK